ncbi:MAG TPA: DUF3500 domain-containing protein [Gemmataceae bacterium]|jgi:hypothetical protein|nr:DUF3500 domain-containing protein [Gemmataceae bacterium]
MKRPTTLVRLVFGLVCVTGLAAVGLVGHDVQPAADQMTEAADGLLDSLPADLRKKAMFEFDDPHRTAWFFTPQQDKDRNFTRKGVRLEELNDEQKKKVLALLKTGTSAHGYEQATGIMGLENILKDAEKKGAMVRNDGWYFVSIFGKPSKTGKWGWRIEGHHLSVSFTVDRGQIESPTPFFFGANPATIKNGSKAGQRSLPEVEDGVRELIKALDADQVKVAHRDKHFPEIGENTPAAKLAEPVGLAGAKMTDKQRELLVKLLEAYTNRMPPNVGASELKAAKDGGVDKIYFAYSGEAEVGKAYTYQIQGPTFVAQFLNIQADGYGNQNNHIHSVWRRLPADFGLNK